MAQFPKKITRSILRGDPRPSFPGPIAMGFFFLFWMALGGFAFAQQPVRLKVITTLFPLQEFARAVGGDRIQADLLLPPGAEPHNWEPKPSDFAKIAGADVFLGIGPMMEPWAAKVLKAVNNPKLHAIEVSRGLPLLAAEEEVSNLKHPGRAFPEKHWDPHLWLDFSLAARIVDSIAEVFSTKDSAHAPFYRREAEKYKEKLAALDRAYRGTLSKCRRRQIIVGGHSAFAYFARRYNLEQVALYGISPNAEPTPKKLAMVIESARQHQAEYIFFEVLVNPKLSQVLAREAGIGTLVLQAGANLTKEQLQQNLTFLELMKSNLDNLSRGLGCHAQ